MNPVKTFLKKHLSRDEVFLSILLLVTPLTAFYLMQFAYSGGLPWEYSLNVLLANYLCIGVVHFTLCAVTNYIVVCSILTHILCCIWGIANHYVSLFRGTPILPWDFTALGTAAAVADSYQFSLNIPMAISILLIAAMIFLLRKSSKQDASVRPKIVCACASPTFVRFCSVPIRSCSQTRWAISALKPMSGISPNPTRRMAL